MEISFLITGEEVLNLPNNYELGTYVRKKYHKTIQDVKSYISDDGYDLCIICGKKTEYKTDTHISQRIGYIEGMGQTCPEINKCGIN